jgi:hypothetical protein
VTLDVRDASGTLVHALQQGARRRDPHRRPRRGAQLEAQAAPHRGGGRQSRPLEPHVGGVDEDQGAKIDTGDLNTGRWPCPAPTPEAHRRRTDRDGTVEVNPTLATMTAAERAEQLRFASRSATRSPGWPIVEGVRAVRDQLQAAAPCSGNGAAASWVKSAGALVPRLDALEGEPTTRRPRWPRHPRPARGPSSTADHAALDWVRDADGVPTQG